jgi:glycosyltransferase involved in cell wall biosynthesis
MENKKKSTCTTLFMKTILHVIDTTGPGGAETIFVQLADKIREYGYRSVVLIRGPGWIQEELRRRGLTPIIIENKAAFNLDFLFKLREIIYRENVDLIQSHLLGSNVYCAIVGLITNKPVVATFHGLVDFSQNERLLWLKIKLMKYGISRFIVVSHSLREDLCAKGLLSQAETEVIYNGIDFANYGKSTKRKLRNQLGLPDNAILIGSLGNVRQAKGYDILINAAGAVVHQKAAVHFVIAGDINNNLMIKLSQQMTQLNVSKHVHFIGYANDSAEFLSQLDIFLLPSTSEGFSIATIEAMATGLPVIVTRCGGPMEIVRSDVDGLTVASGDAKSISEGLLHLLTDSKTSERLALSAKIHITENFCLDKMLLSYNEIYKKYVGHPRKFLK